MAQTTCVQNKFPRPKNVQTIVRYIVLQYKINVKCYILIRSSKSATNLSIGNMSKYHAYHKYSDTLTFKAPITTIVACFVLFVCVEVLRPSQANGVMSSTVSLPNHTFTGQT